MGKRFLFNKKAKGTAGENELIHRFWDNNWVCVRVAGSGATQYPSPDLLASRGDKRIVMEVKVISDVKKYFTRTQIKDLEYFAEKFGAEAWVGVRFEDDQWFFLPTFELEMTKAENYVIDLITMKRKGFTFDEMIK